MLFTISIMVFGAAFFSILSLNGFWMKDHSAVSLRLKRFSEGVAKSNLNADADLRPSKSDPPSKRRLRKKLNAMGLHHASDLQAAMKMRRFFYLVPVTLVALLYFMGFPPIHIVICGGLFTFIFMLLLRVWMIRKVMQRRRLIQKNLPNAVDLMVVCLEAGMSLDTSLLRVATEQKRVSPQLSVELTLTNQEISAGGSREQALKNLAARTSLDDVKSLSSTIIQAMKLGTSLVRTLKIQAVAMRKKKREETRALIQKMPVKLIFPLLLFIFPTLFIVVLGPSLINIFRHFTSVGY
ncbi:MAG: type II secretion system F family protein [Candidatus Omnitrophota bacterium]|nr:type II secretion system F family protein [Candidatus Omnitrophota bacterium]